MTDSMRDLIVSESDESSAERQAPRYFIDLPWLEMNGRSFRSMAQGRFSAVAQSKLGTVTQERVPTVEKKSHKVVYEVKDVRFGDQPMAVIRSVCSKERNYITPETPVLECVFRVLLATGNQPATIERIREQLGDWISLRDRPHGYAPELIERLINHDHRYGIRQFAMSVD